MTMNMLNELINASMRGTLIAITIFFWICGLVIIWKWLLGIAKRFTNWLFPNFFKKKKSTTEADKN